MTNIMSAHRAPQIVAIALITTVVTQILYMAFLGGPQPSDPAVGMTNADIVAYFTDRWSEVALVWTVEAIAFAAVALGGLIALARGGGNHTGWAAIALCGVFNLVQVGMGLSLFKPAALAGEEYGWIFGMVVAGAFFFYFAAKAFVGLAAIVFGLSLLKTGTAKSAKIVSVAAVLAGLAALVTNIAGMGMGMTMVLIAGAAGTAAALLAAIVILMVSRAPAR